MFNPIIFALLGASIAGQFGMTMQIFKSITAVTISWTSTKIPLWSDLISKRNFKKLDFSFHKVLRDSICSSFLVTSLIVILLLFNYFNLEILEKVLPLKLVVILGLTIPVNNILNSLATQLRCHKKSPMHYRLLFLGLLITLSTFINAKFFSILVVWLFAYF